MRIRQAGVPAYMKKTSPKAPLMINNFIRLASTRLAGEATLGAGAVVDQEPEFIGALRPCE